MTTPELPTTLPPGTTLIVVVDPLPCDMLRCGLPCGNDATFVLVCPSGPRRLIPFCDMCMRDASAAYANWTRDLERVVSPQFADWMAAQ